MKRKVLVTGAEGMLGTELVIALKKTKKYEVHETDIDDLDITDLEGVKEKMLSVQPDLVIHTAAYTAVDQSEKEPLTCFMVNAEATKNLAFFARELKAEMLYLGTDYVFDGKKGSPYVEADPTNPINTYGASKLKGEEYICTLLERHKIIRTSWLNGPFDPTETNFIEKIVRTATERGELSVVDDQLGKPTFTFDLASTLVRLIELPDSGVFHITNEGACSWYEFACEIIKQARLKRVTIKPVSTKAFRTLAKRPAYSVLENRRLKELGFKPLPHWRESLKRYFKVRKQLRKK